MATPTFTNGIGDDFLASLGKAQPQISKLDRAGYHLVNAPAAAVQGLTKSIGNILGIPVSEPEPETQIPAGQTGGDIALDLVGAGILPMALELAATGALGRAAGLAKFEKVNPLGGLMARDALAFGVLGAQDDRATGIEQAAEGAGFGYLAKYGRFKRLLPAAAGGMMSKTFFDRDGETPILPGSTISEGDAAGWAGALTALAPGMRGWTAPVAKLADALPNHFATGAKFDTDINTGYPVDESLNVFKGVGRPPLPPGIDPIQAWAGAGIHNPSPSDMRIREALGYDPMAKRNDSFLEMVTGVKANYPAADAADVLIEQGLPKRTYTPAQPMVEPVLTGKSALRSAQVMDVRVETPELARQKSKLPSLPEHLRGQGGSVSLDLLNSLGIPLARTAVGSTVGAVAGEEAGIDPMTGAVLGGALLNMPAGLRAGLGLAQKVFAPIAKQTNSGSIRDPFSVVPAIKVHDKIIKGVKGDTHKNILNRHLAENPDDVDALMNFDSKQNPNFFMDAEGNAITREGLQQSLGVKSSQELANIQKTEVAPVAKVKPTDIIAQRMLETGDDYDKSVAEKWNRLSPSTKEAIYDAANLERTKESKLGRLEWGRETGDSNRSKDGAKAAITRRNNEAEKLVNAEVEGFGATALTFAKGEGRFNRFYEEASLKPLTKEGGFLFPEMQAAMARSTIGALVGGGIGGAMDDEPSSGFMLGALTGAAAFGGGPSLARAVREALSRTTVTPATGTASRPKSWMNLVKNFGQTVEEASGRALATNANPTDRFLRFMDKALDISMPTVVKETLMRARGAASFLLSTMDSALTKVAWRYKPDQVMKDLAMQHLDGSIDATAFSQQVANAFPGDVFSQQYAQFIMSGRKSVDGLQRMVKEGISDPNLKQIIDRSIGKYLTRSYKIFTSPEWEPSIQSIDNLVGEIQTLNALGPNISPAEIRTHLEAYVREVKARKGLYGKPFSAGSAGEKINQQVLRERKLLSDAWREFLGEITDPTERLYQTTFRLRPMAEAARYMDQLSTVKEDGWMPHRFSSYTEKAAFEQRLLHDVQNAPNAQDAAVAQGKLDKFRLKWTGAQSVEKHPKFGNMQGHIVTRNVWDTLATYDSFTDPTSSPLLRSIAGAHTAIKLARTAFNPITVVRNFITMPMFATIARAHPQDWREAWTIMRDPNHPMFKEIMENGISNVDQVKTEFFKEFENVTGGKYNFGNLDLSSLGLGKFDLDMAEKMGRRGIRNWLDVYRLPDNMVRIGSYLSAKRRFAQELNKPVSDPDVIAKATTFVNRYTMNYDTVAPAVKVARQVPFVNLFITYTAEMTRILKNLGDDLVKGSNDGTRHNRMYAALPLTMLAVVPELWQTVSENDLSPKDKVDWEKAKKLMPAYARTRYRVGIHRNAQGQFEYTDITPLIASDALNQSVKALVTGDMKALASVNPLVGIENTPALNVVAAQIAGKDLHTHREFRGTADRIATVAKEVLPPWFPGIGAEAQRFSQAHATNVDGTQGVTNLKTGQRLTPGDFWQPYYSGVKTGSTNLNVLQTRAVSEAKRNIANEVAYLNDVLKTDVSNEVKQQTLERAKTAIAEIQENLRQRVETQ